MKIQHDSEHDREHCGAGGRREEARGHGVKGGGAGVKLRKLEGTDRETAGEGGEEKKVWVETHEAAENSCALWTEGDRRWEMGCVNWKVRSSE